MEKKKTIDKTTKHYRNLREELLAKLDSSSLGRKRVTLKILLWKITLGFSFFIKRLIDIIGAIVLIILLSPFLLITAILIYIESPGPIFFKQIRVGLNGKHFDFFKFRSMKVNADALKKELMDQNESGDGVIFKMKDDPRITKVGKFIRKYSIDELPQFYNVLIGDMSLVGPRPPVPSEVKEYTLDDRKRLNVKPGLTCIWQISGRSDIPFKQQVELDKEYIANKNFIKDILILLKTVPAVVFSKGAY